MRHVKVGKICINSVPRIHLAFFAGHFGHRRRRRRRRRRRHHHHHHHHHHHPDPDYHVGHVP